MGDRAIGAEMAASDRQMPNRHTNIYLKLKLLTANLFTGCKLGSKMDQASAL